MNASKKINARKVWPRAQVSHLWAAQSPMQTEARESGNRCASYFEGPTLYSYGSHYVAGHFTNEKDADGRRVVLVSTDKYSVTTGDVLSDMTRALRSLPLCVIEFGPNDYMSERDVYGLNREGNRADVVRLLSKVSESWMQHADKMRKSAARRRETWTIESDLRAVDLAANMCERIAQLPIVKAMRRERGDANAPTRSACGRILEAAAIANRLRFPWYAADGETRLDVHAWAKEERASIAKVKREAEAWEAINDAMKDAADYAKAKRAGLVPPHGLRNMAKRAADAIADAHAQAKKHKLELPRAFPVSAAYYTREHARLAPLAVVSELEAYAETMKDGAREAVRKLAKGKRYQSAPPRASRILTPAKRREVVAGIRSARVSEMPRDWESLANLAASLERCQKEADDKIEAARAFNPDTKQTRDGVRALRSSLFDVYEIHGRARRAFYIRAATAAAIEARDNLETLTRINAMPFAELLDGARLNYCGGWRTAYARNLETFKARRRDAESFTQETRGHGVAQRVARYLDGLAANLPATLPAFEAIARAQRVENIAERMRVCVNATERVNSGIRAQVSGASLRGSLASLDETREAIDGALAGFDPRGIPAEDWHAVMVKREETQAAAIETAERARAYIAAYVAPTRASWIAGGAIWEGAERDAVALRLDARGYVETSHGAQVPTDAARTLWRMVARCKRDGKAVHTPPPVRVGAFELRHIHANGDCQVGCHAISYAAALEFATAQGWTREDVAAVQA